MPHAYVYLLRHMNTRTFKIGVTANIHGRIPNIGGYEAFDLTNSLCARFEREAIAKRFEKLIHATFKNWNVEPNKNDRRDGDTEHFYTACFDEVVSLLATNSNLVGLSIQKIPPTPSLPISHKSKAEKERRIIEKQEKLLTKNLASFENWQNTVNWLDKNQDQILQESFDTEGRLSIKLAISEKEAKEIFKICFFQSGCCSLPYGTTRITPHSKTEVTLLLTSPIDASFLCKPPDFIESVEKWFSKKRQK